MFENHLRIALRNLRRHKGYAFVNIAGLAVGMACCLLILLFVRDERSYDRFHAQADQIYRLVREAYGQAPSAQQGSSIGLRIADALPEVQQVVRVFKHWEVPLVASGPSGFIEPSFYFADSTFFGVFSFALEQGDPASALVAPNSVVLTRAAARKYFGDADPMGQTLQYNTEHELTVTGVLAEVPNNSHIHPDFIASLGSLPNVSYARILEEWGVFYTYLLLGDGAVPGTVAREATALMRQGITSANPPRLRLQPLTDIHLYSQLEDELEVNGDVRYVWLLSAIGLLILLIACINYMNLATARSMGRAREVGVRKVAGANRVQLVLQFFGESFVLAMVAFVLAVGLAQGALPVLNSWLGKTLALHLTDGGLLLGSLGVVLAVSMVAGSYPALFLSRFRPAEVLKGKFKSGSEGRRLRQGLVIVQFGVAIVLIVGTFVIFRQLRYVQEAPLGFDKEQVVVVQVQDPSVRGRYEAVREAFLRNPSVRAVGASSSSYPGQRHSGGHRVLPEGAAPEAALTLRRNWIDANYLTTLGVELAAGRGFAADRSDDSLGAVLLNESAVRALGWASAHEAVGQTLELNPGSGEGRGTVVGVVQDFNFQSMHEHIAPLLLTPHASPTNMLVRIQPRGIDATLGALRAAWEAFTDQPFTYRFLDDTLEAQYRADARWGWGIAVASLLAIFIACLGLFGLAAFMAEQRTKEIGIRKVMGASVPGIVLLMARTFLQLVAIAFVLASPVAYLLMQRWLEAFAYRIEPGGGTFLLAGAAVLFIALATVSSQALRAALVDPVKSLRYE